jgi:tetratricopeptide (TPR) repeat protein
VWYEEVLEKHPGFPRALEGLGLALLALGLPTEAARCLGEAVAAAPERSKTRMALARAFMEAGRGAESEQEVAQALRLDPRKAALARAERAQLEGRMEDAEKLLRELLAKDPDDEKALRMLGNIALEVSHFKAARRLLKRAVDLSPGFAPGWNDLANVDLKQDRYEEALQKIQRAIDIDPEMAHSYVVRGNVLARALRHEESLAAYRKALDLNSNNIGALAGMGHVLKTIGRQQESIAAYRQCIRAHPAFGEAYWSLANLKTFEFDTAEVEVMTRMVEEQDLPDEPKVNFLLSLGKHFENEAEYDRAFEYYRRGNDLRRGHEVYDPVQTQVIHDRIISVFSKDFFVQREGFGNPGAAPILVVGLPRSGSTLIEQILASHSMVEGTMELPDLGRIIGDLNKGSARKPASQSHDQGQGKATGWGKERAGQRLEYPEAVLDLDSEQAAALGAGYLQSTMRYRTGKPYFIDKMPNNFPSIGLLQMILPNAKVINARRHPLDSCLGSYKQLFFKGQSFTYDQFELGQYYLEYQRIMDHWHEVLPGKVLDVHYEQMVLDQETQTRRILDYLCLPWEDQCLRFYETDRAVNTASSEQVRQPMYTSSVNFWKNYEAHLGELIETLEPLLLQLPEQDRPVSLCQQAG